MADIQGLLSNPLLQVGLGILANNDNKNFGRVLGRGALTGLGNLQQQQQFQAQLAQQQQVAKLNQARQQQLEQEMQQQSLKQEAINNAIKNNPDMADAFAINPEAALKSLMPKLNTADPFYKDVYIGGKVYAFDARTGDYIPKDLGGSNLPNKDDPKVQFGVAGAKSAGENLYQPTDMKDGVILPKTNLAIESGAPSIDYLSPNAAPSAPRLPTQPSMPNPQKLPQLGSPSSMQIPPSVQQERDAKRMQVLLAEQAADGGPGRNPELDKEIARFGGNMPIASAGGIKVPTKAEEAAAIEKAKSEVGIGIDKTKNVKKADQFLTVANQAKLILDDEKNKPTSSGLGSAVDSAGNFFGVAPKGANEAARLETLSGWMVANVPRMEGPQSNFDVQNYQTMAGMIGDRTKPLSVRQEALKEVISLQEKYKALNQDGNILPKDEKMPKVMALPAKPSTLTLKKDTVYQTPKGALRWNGKAFED